MRKSRFTEAQIIGMIKEQEAGMPTAEVCRRHGLSAATFYKLKSKYGAMTTTRSGRIRPWPTRHRSKRAGRLSNLRAPRGVVAYL
jgi:transposase-like protein